jgi:hypothetical protein
MPDTYPSHYKEHSPRCMALVMLMLLTVQHLSDTTRDHTTHPHSMPGWYSGLSTPHSVTPPCHVLSIDYNKAPSRTCAGLICTACGLKNNFAVVV